MTSSLAVFVAAIQLKKRVW